MLPRSVSALAAPLAIVLYFGLGSSGGESTRQREGRPRIISSDFDGFQLRDELQGRLREIDNMRKGFGTNVDAVAERCQALLKEYTAPEEQARIYYLWVHVLGQSGIPKPALQIELAQKALSLPSGEESRLNLYAYWGAAIEVSHRGATGDALAAARAEAMVPYLELLAECLDDIAEAEDSPITVPVDPMPANNLLGPGPETRKKMLRGMAESTRADKLKHLRVFQKQLEDKTAQLYSRKPFATAEIEKLAREYVPDEAARKRLIARVVEEVEKREAQDHGPIGKGSSENRTLRHWFLGSNVVAVIAIACLVVWRRRRRHQQIDKPDPPDST